MSYQRPHKSVTSQTLARWMKTILTQAGVDPGVWKPHAVRSASSSHHNTTRQLDLEQICRLADWSMASSTYLKFYKRYVWVLPSTFILLFVLMVLVPLLYWKLRSIIFLPRVSNNFLIISSHFVLRSKLYTVCIFILQIYFCEFALGYMFFIYPLTEVHKITRGSECYASFLLAPAEGWSLFTL